jgi:sugar phosphate isomerase/epimerase
MKRRQFITKSSLATAGIAIASTPLLSNNLFAANAAKIDKIGFQVYTVRNQVRENLTDTLKQLSKAGYDYAEVYGLFGDSVMGHPVKDIKKEFKRAGIELRSAHCNTGTGSKNKGTFSNEWQMGVDVAAELGITHTVCPHLGANERKTIDDYKKVAELMNKAGEISKKSGIQMGYHNHAFEFETLEGQIPFDVLAKEMDADLVKFELDIYWAVKAKMDPIKLFETHAGRINQWHVKDMSKVNEGMAEVGMGRIDWANLFTKAKQSGLTGFFVEQDRDWATSDVESLKTSASFLNELEY